jgi:hypothetical protein
MAQAIITLIENPDMMKDVGLKGRQRFLQEFCFPKFYSTIKYLYRNVMPTK